MKEKNAFLEYLREREHYKRITMIRKLVSYSFLGLFLYFLFSVSYTASPAIAILNYLALFTSFSGIIFLKMNEIPKCILEIQSKGNQAEIFRLTEKERFSIIETTAREMNLFYEGMKELNFDAKEIKSLFRLDERLPWRRIGGIYTGIYLLTVITFCIYLISDYMETGFMRP